MFVCDYGKNKKFLLYLAWILANSSARWVTQGESLSPASDLANEGAAEIQICAERLLELRECVTRVGTIITFDCFDGANPVAGKGIHARSPTRI